MGDGAHKPKEGRGLLGLSALRWLSGLLYGPWGGKIRTQPPRHRNQARGDACQGHDLAFLGPIPLWPVTTTALGLVLSLAAGLGETQPPAVCLPATAAAAQLGYHLSSGEGVVK